MKHTLFVAMIAVFLVTADDKKPDGKKDLDLVKGKWTIVSVIEDGKTNEEESGGTITFAEDKMVLQVRDGEHTGTFKLDTGKKPKQIDVTPLDGPEKGKVMEGIYELTKDGLKICIADHAGTIRPTAFASKEDSGLVLLTLKRKQ
jgi:uncharacterized protein (TIGR03067 family)